MRADETLGTLTMKKLIILGVAALILAACNTVEGVGRDVQAAGGAVADSARDAKN